MGFRALVTVLLLAGSIGAAAAQVPQRKNIDLLTPQELAAYEHAIQILKDRSTANSYDKAGYLWQAWVHNCFFIWQPPSNVGSHGNGCDRASRKPDPTFIAVHPGMCEHGKDLFLAWHRAEFYYFEQLLRAADPDGSIADSRGRVGPSTANVAIPFWNWTRPPSGERYPLPFENEDSPLYHEKRNRGALTPAEKALLDDVTSPEALAALVYDTDWKGFGGYPQESTVGGYGRFESAHHNPMHGRYFGGDMANPGLAALDPGFYSFHAYIDLIYQFGSTNKGKSRSHPRTIS